MMAYAPGGALPVSGWKRGDVVTITDDAHPRAICILTSDDAINDSGDLGAWRLLDDTCWAWRTTVWVESHAPKLIVRDASSPAEQRLTEMTVAATQHLDDLIEATS